MRATREAQLSDACIDASFRGCKIGPPKVGCQYLLFGHNALHEVINSLEDNTAFSKYDATRMTHSFGRQDFMMRQHAEAKQSS